ncbi:MAG: hypothetical protein ACLSHM_01685 [Vescimonas sp.]
MQSQGRTDAAAAAVRQRRGRTLQQAVRQAAAGDASAMSQMLQGIMSSPRGAALVQRIGESLQK